MLRIQDLGASFSKFGCFVLWSSFSKLPYTWLISGGTIKEGFLRYKFGGLILGVISEFYSMSHDKDVCIKLLGNFGKSKAVF